MMLPAYRLAGTDTCTPTWEEFHATDIIIGGTESFDRTETMVEGSAIPRLATRTYRRWGDNYYTPLHSPTFTLVSDDSNQGRGRRRSTTITPRREEND